MPNKAHEAGQKNFAGWAVTAAASYLWRVTQHIRYHQQQPPNININTNTNTTQQTPPAVTNSINININTTSIQHHRHYQQQ